MNNKDYYSHLLSVLPLSKLQIVTLTRLTERNHENGAQEPEFPIHNLSK